MPYALVVIGLLLIVTGAKNTYKQFGNQVAGDFKGDQSFVYWIIALGTVGAVGYNKTLQPMSRMFMALIMISFVIKNGGVFDQFITAIEQGPIEPTQTAMTDGSGVFSTASMDNSVNSVAQTAQASITASEQAREANISGFTKIIGTVLPLIG